ncbi:uncharacterized protein G2W53_019845 [Senna tora]|uniref:Uncharacterized protein n=1 Tax=Senna tora TaxID=362788 RepID=A0A834WR39_9FABA|nr:uncharacterized protein G2W53_019845 [Senna tora]
MGNGYRFFQEKRLEKEGPLLAELAENDKIGRRIGGRIIAAFLSVQPVYLPPPLSHPITAQFLLPTHTCRSILSFPF